MRFAQSPHAARTAARRSLVAGLVRRCVPLAACAAALAAAAPADASFPGRNGRIAFTPQYFMPQNSIATVAAPFETRFIPTGAVTRPANIAWSPDGRRLAFDGPATSGGTGRALYIVNADGSGLRQVGRGDRLRSDPAWSPDGGRLVFTQDDGARGGQGNLYTMTTSGGSLTRITGAPTHDAQPDWSPDGTRIAYVCVSGGRRHVCQVTPTGSGMTVTTAGLGFTDVGSVSWSPNSSALAIHATRPGLADFRAFRLSRWGAPVREFAAVDIFKPAWSPDGSRIAFQQAGAVGGDFGLRTVAAHDGRGLLELGYADDSFNLDPSGWQPLR
jgi:dipeptidyl aminopeptidase/acylaminoacyl peptidase